MSLLGLLVQEQRLKRNIQKEVSKLICDHDCLNCKFDDCINDGPAWTDESADHYTIDRKKWTPRQSNYQKYKQYYSDYHKRYYQEHREELLAKQKKRDAMYRQQKS